jgi:energy-coupling factor transporter ATP-binding protein EcfA2
MKIDQVEEHKGLKIKACELLETKVIAIVRRNGAGKSRLFEAIAEGKIKIAIAHDEIPRLQIQHLTGEKLQPNFILGFNSVQHKANIESTKAAYRHHCGKFLPDLQQTINLLGPIIGRMQLGVNTHTLANTVITASHATGKDVNALNDQDIVDAYSSEMSQLGTLNVTTTILEYIERQEQNDFNEFRNKRYAKSFLYRTDEEFKSRFGPPPWDVLNDVLKSVLDGRYCVPPPTLGNTGGYEARLTLLSGQEIDPSFLSSGEKVLLWLSLSMYKANSKQAGTIPKLLLLDEPDATLHPQMIQKLHIVLDAIARNFNCSIIFTTHSPTTVALFNGPIYQISEDDLTFIEQDVAISELLVGVDQISIYFSNRRQIYVESNRDVEIYSTLFRLLRQWKLTLSAHISLSFIAAAPKLTEDQIRTDLKAVFGDQDETKVGSYIEKINGHGNDAGVKGIVEKLSKEKNDTVYGIVDWDTVNISGDRIYVHGANIFYTMENAILNPLTLGLYILHNFQEKIDCSLFGLTAGFDLQSVYETYEYWQKIADAVTQQVLGIDDIKHEIECSFIRGGTVKFDKRYAHVKGHELEEKVCSKSGYAFLRSVRRPLVLDVLNKGIAACHGRSLPSTFKDLFGAIQLADQVNAIQDRDESAACKPMSTTAHQTTI